MADKILVFERLAYDPATDSYFQLILIDGGGVYNAFIKDVAEPEFPGLAADITSAGAVPVIAPSGVGNVSGVGTTNVLPKWTDGPNSVVGNSRIIDDAQSILIPMDAPIGDVVVGNSQTKISVNADASGGSMLLQSNTNLRISLDGPNSILAFGILTNTGNRTRFSLDDTTGTLLFSSTLNGAVSLEANDSTQVITLTAPSLVVTGVVSFPDNTRQTFNPGADAAGLNVGSNAGDPSAPSNGDLWYDSTGNLLRARINGVSVSLNAQAVSVSPQASTPVALSATTDVAKAFTNEGAGALIVFNLPAAAAGLEYTFIVQDADGIEITAGAGDTIRIGASVSSAGGTATSTDIGSTLTLVAINATEWMAISNIGVWVLA